MSLRKPPTLTPELLEANRRNARRSIGPHTGRGKVQSRLNGLGNVLRSRFYHDFMILLMETPPDELERTAWEILTPKKAGSRLFKGMLRMIPQANLALVVELWKAYRMGGGGEDSGYDEQSLNMSENTRQLPDENAMSLKNKGVTNFCPDVYEKNEVMDSVAPTKPECC